jgi:hypothetical protein
VQTPTGQRLLTTGHFVSTPTVVAGDMHAGQTVLTVLHFVGTATVAVGWGAAHFEQDVSTRGHRVCQRGQCVRISGQDVRLLGQCV